MSRNPTAPPSETPSRRFGREIAAALAAGATVEDLVLHVTLMDASKVKRDSDLPLEHISFSPDGMRFLGVRVVEGKVRSSVLLPADEAAQLQAAEPPPAKPAAKPRKAKAAAR